MDSEGIEPSTSALQRQCSTIELRALLRPLRGLRRAGPAEEIPI